MLERGLVGQRQTTDDDANRNCGALHLKSLLFTSSGRVGHRAESDGDAIGTTLTSALRSTVWRLSVVGCLLLACLFSSALLFRVLVHLGGG